MNGYFLFALLIFICFYNLFLFVKYLCDKVLMQELNIKYGFKRKYLVYLINQVFAIICLILIVFAIVYL